MRKGLIPPSGVLFGFAAVVLASCASKPPTNSGDAQVALQKKWTGEVGTATKEDFITSYGPASWCHERETGGEQCRFYNKLGTKWLGDKKDRKSYEAFDELIADFGESGKLESVKARSQR